VKSKPPTVGMIRTEKKILKRGGKKGKEKAEERGRII
jgi:hypothetical protein